MEKEMLQSIIQAAYEGWAENTFAPFGLGDGPIWEPPLFGIAAGDDPIFTHYKQVIGSFHWAPGEIWALARPDDAVPPADLTVLTLCFPQAVETVDDQQVAQGLPAPRWVFARNSWNSILPSLSRNLLTLLTQAGIDAVAPDQLPQFSMVQDDVHGLCSRWSHRHAAFACGLGTFGLSDGFITRRGMAVRFFTLVLRGRWPADPRPTENPYGWCLYYQNGSCGACIVRCPAECVTTAGHDKAVCQAALGRCYDAYQVTPGFNPEVEAGCGLCQAAVPCARRKPGKE